MCAVRQTDTTPRKAGHVSIATTKKVPARFLEINCTQGETALCCVVLALSGTDTIEVRWVPRSKEKTKKTKVHCSNRQANSCARTALTESLHQEESVVFLCQARNVRQNVLVAHLHPCLHRSVQTLQFSDCAICRHQEKKVRPLPKFGEHKKSTPRSERCAHLSSRVQVCHESRDCRCFSKRKDIRRCIS